eukprot:1120985-Amorphochlora_amoeboformis.AAC.2
MIHRFEQGTGILDSSFSLDDTKAFAGGIDGKLRMMDFKEANSAVLGSHSKGIKCVEYCDATGLVITGGWDEMVGSKLRFVARDYNTFPDRSKCGTRDRKMH